MPTPVAPKARPVPRRRLARDDVDADAAQARRGPGEVLVDDVLVQAHRLEDLGAAVALDGGDPHLGDDLHHALVQGLDVVLDRVLLVHAGQHPLAHEVVQGLEGEVGIHRARAVADEQREVMHLARLAALDDEADLRARAFADQVMVHAGHGQQRGDGRVLGVHAAVGEDHDVGARPHRFARRGGRRRPWPSRGPSPPASGGNRIGMVVALKAQAPERPLGVLR